jgi:hypothetical protein
MTEPTRPDVTVENHLGLILLRPETDAGRDWLQANAAAEPWQWQNGALAVDGPTYAAAIVTAMRDDGLIVDGEAS